MNFVNSTVFGDEIRGCWHDGAFSSLHCFATFWIVVLGIFVAALLTIILGFLCMIIVGALKATVCAVQGALAVLRCVGACISCRCSGIKYSSVAGDLSNKYRQISTAICVCVRAKHNGHIYTGRALQAHKTAGPFNRTHTTPAANGVLKGTLGRIVFRSRSRAAHE